jgi:peptide deformylase
MICNNSPHIYQYNIIIAYRPSHQLYGMKRKQLYCVALLLLSLPHGNDALSVVTRRQMAVKSSVPFFALLLEGGQVDSASAAVPTQSEEGFRYASDWTGTSLTWMDIETASQSAWTMGRWPDPTLRRVARPVEPQWFGTRALQQVATLLEQTAVENEAVGLAAQQCGVDARMVFLDTSSTSRRKSKGSTSLIMVNPNIVERSSETDMRVWNEFCLVLPPAFRATVLRDAWIVVEFQDVATGAMRSMKLQGETARAAQHELDHDRGILTLDHIGFEEMETDVMRSIEREGHEERQQLAFSRAVIESVGA